MAEAEEPHLATKADVARVEGQCQLLDAKIDARSDQLDAKIDAQSDQLGKQLEQRMNQQLIWIVGAWLAVAALILSRLPA